MINDEGLAASGPLRPMEDVLANHLQLMEEALVKGDEPESVRLSRLAHTVGVLRAILGFYRKARAAGEEAPPVPRESCDVCAGEGRVRVLDSGDDGRPSSWVETCHACRSPEPLAVAE